MFGQLENLTIVYPNPFEYRRRIMEGVRENMKRCVPPGDQLAI